MIRFYSLHVSLLMILTLALCAPRAAQGAESYDNCTGFITSVPTTISTQGTWCFKQDLSTPITTGHAITINANNVTIDCNGFKLDNSAAGTGTGTEGIYALDKLNASIRHCKIRGFYSGIYLDGSSGGGHAVEDNLLDGNTLIGVQVYGDGSTIRRNRIYNTGGSTLNNTANPIGAAGEIDLVGNLVSGATATAGHNGSTYGMYVFGNNAGRIIGNRIRGLKQDGTGLDYGIELIGGSRVAVRDNDLVGDASVGSIGVDCSVTNVDLRNNVLSGFANGMVGCVDNGNDVVP